MGANAPGEKVDLAYTAITSENYPGTMQTNQQSRGTCHKGRFEHALAMIMFNLLLKTLSPHSIEVNGAVITDKTKTRIDFMEAYT